jgi:hypothetical protein
MFFWLLVYAGRRRGFYLKGTSMNRLRGLLALLILTSCGGSGKEATPASLHSPDPMQPLAGDPVLAFSDLAYGPSTGNSDTSLGQTAGQDGAIVSVWGLNLGASQGSSSISVGGVPASKIYYWGNAVPPYSPARLYNDYQRLQIVIFQISHLTPAGPVQISAGVGGRTSNALPFTVGPGRILFVALTGNDANPGTFQAPFRTTGAGMDALLSGDITYVRDGVNQTGGVVLPYSTKSPTAPIAIAAYPGATCRVGDSTHEGFNVNYSGSGNSFTYSKFSIMGNQQAVSMYSNDRLVGCTIQTPVGASPAGAVGGAGNNLAVLGNEFTNCGTPDPLVFDNLYHVLYIGGFRGIAPANAFLETEREIAWNYFHDNFAARAINIYNGEPTSNPIALHRIHDNVIINQVMDGILLGNGVVGENWVYNNLIMDAGKGLVAGGGRSGINVRVGNPPSVVSGQPIVVHISNNTILNCGAPGENASGAFILAAAAGWTPDVHNNLILQATGFPYYTVYDQAPTGVAAQWSNNLWFGAGPAPAGDASSVNADPKVVSSAAPFDLHLKSGSPAIGTGINLGVASRTFDGLPRPAVGAWSIGAY